MTKKTAEELMRPTYLTLLACCLVSALTAVGIYHFTVAPSRMVIRETVPARYTHYIDPLGEKPRARAPLTEPRAFTQGAALVTPAVVNIRTRSKGNFQLFGERNSTSSSGSGVIISQDGYVVTNYHVIKGGAYLDVTLADKREYTAKLVGSDPTTDLALLKIEEKGLPYLEFGNSDEIQVGEWVLAVGNPFNLESTVTAGIVSAKGRSIDILESQDRIESFIQTDAVINPGNSGGALVTSTGELVGINTAIITQSGRFEGYSFAVPSNLVHKVVRDLRDYGIAQRGLMGVFIDDIDAARARKLGLRRAQGVYISRVTAGSGAEAAGLKPGDVILSIDGKSVDSKPTMQEQIGRYRPGNTLEVAYLRGKKKAKATVILKGKENPTSRISTTEEDHLRDLGFELRDLTPEEKSRLGMDGVKVMSIYRRSKVEKTNMDPNFIIVRINDIPVKNLNDFIGQLKKSSGEVLLEGYYEEFEGEYFYSFNL